jgi:hypothetical protein
LSESAPEHFPPIFVKPDLQESHLTPEYPVLQTHVFGPAQVPFPEQTALLESTVPKHEYPIHLLPENPSRQTQESVFIHVPFPLLQTAELVELIPKQFESPGACSTHLLRVFPRRVTAPVCARHLPVIVAPVPSEIDV